MKEVRDLSELSAEVAGIAMVLSGLGNQLENDKTDVLKPDAMRSALHGVEIHLERIAEDLANLDT